MEYIVKYTQGNGYTCSCCGDFRGGQEICDSYEEALKSAVECEAADWSDYSYDDIIPIPKIPEDFKQVDGEWVLKFDKAKFETEVKVRAKEIKDERVAAKAKKEKEKEEQREIAKEKRDKSEWKRLKKKYGLEQGNDLQKNI